MEKQQIRISIAHREYTLTVQPELEEDIRKAARNLNAELDNLLNTYDIDVQDALGSILLREEYNLIEARKQNEGDYGKFLSDIRTINGKLEEYLRSR